MKKLLNEILYDAKFIRGHTLQPGWYKILKVVLLLGGLVAGLVIFGPRKTSVFIGIFFTLGLFVHLVYRIKTERFKKSWLDFKVTEIDGQLKYQRIGFYYYLAVVINLSISFFVSCLFID